MIARPGEPDPSADAAPALAGDFRETRFAGLIQRFGTSRQSAAVSVWLAPEEGGGGGAPDGLFHFDRGDLVAASLSGAEGREALRRALRLREGRFTVALGAPPPAGRREAFADVILEELVRLDEDDRSRRAAAPRAGREPAPGTPAPPPAPAATPPAAGRPRPRGRDVTGLVYLAVGAPAALAIAATVFLLLTPPAQKAGDAVQQLLEPAPERVRGVGEREILLGMAAPLGGANRELGRAMKAGIEAALAEVNEAGGVHGRALRLVALDDGYEPSRTVPVMRELVEQQRVFAVVGSVGTPTAAVAIPYCEARDVPFFGALSGGDVLRKDPPDRLVFNFRPSYAEEAAAAVRWLVGARRVDPRRIAVFAQEDEFGASGWRGVAASLAERGVDAAEVLRVGYRRNTADVARAVEALRARAADVDAVVTIATYPAAAALVRGARDARLPLVFTAVSAVAADALAEDLVSAGPRYARDVVVTQVVPPPGSMAPAAVRFRDALARHAPGEPPGFVAFEGFVVGSLLAEGLRRAGRDLDTERLVAALEGIRDLDLGIGARLSFAPQRRQASHRVWVTMLQPDGSYRQVAVE